MYNKRHKRRIVVKPEKTTALFAIAILFFAVMACGGGKPAPARYQGDWVADSGATLYMYADGKAGFRLGSKHVTGGAAEVDETNKKITISLFGISHTWKIDRPPDDKGEMTLDGTVFRKRQ